MGEPAADLKRIKKIEQMLPAAMHADRHAVIGEIKRIKKKCSSAAAGKKELKRLEQVEARIARSASIKKSRRDNLPFPSYPENLPITGKKDEIVEAVKNNPVVIVSGETGSGKTTQIPKMCLEAGRGVEGAVGCTQPRRIAAVTVAQRIAEEMGENPGESVGYQIRFQEMFNREKGFIKVMTDGILLAEAQGDRFLNGYDTIIVDEAHERSLNIDFLLGMLRRLVKTRKNLKVIITSATIDTEKFSAAFDSAPVIEVSGRMYPVSLHYEEQEEEAAQEEDTYVDKAVDAVDRIVRGREPGDILVFMPTEQDIRETCEILEGRGYPGAAVLPLFARLPAAQQMQVFRPAAGRKIVVATNVAETSITVPGIRFVIDTGLARISRYDPRSRTTSLPISPISRSSADQRKGRCGRVEHGVCIRLYSEFDYESRPLFTAPEIQRANLSEVILRMMALNLGDIHTFPFIDPPPVKQIKDGFDLLLELGAIAPFRGRERKGKQGGSKYRLTKRGRLMAGIPLDPRLSRMLIEAAQLGCLREVAVIAAALTIIDPRERPAGEEKKAEAAHGRFKDPSSDFITWLNIWRACFGEPALERGFVRARDLKRFCRENYFSFRRMREWQDVHEQITWVLNDAGLKAVGEVPAEGGNSGEEDFPPGYAAIHRSILTGFLSNIAVKKEKNIYQAAKNRQMMIFPGSGVFNRARTWVVASEMVETTRLFGRNVASIDRTWLEPAGGSLCRRTCLNPRWDKVRGAVIADERVSLFGLVIEPGRPKTYGPVDPEGAAEIFIREALIEGRVEKERAFMRHNWSLADEVRDMENRLRRRDLLVDESAVVDFYRSRLGCVYDMAGLDKKIREKGSDRFLRMEIQDLLNSMPGDSELCRFPDTLSLGGSRYKLSYRFEPGSEADGVTASIPASEASSVPMEHTDWTVPGLLAEKVEALIRALPKSLRRKLLPVNETVGIIMKEMPKYRGSMLAELSRFIHERFGVDVPVSQWRENEIPDHLRLRFSVTGSGGEELAAGRDRQVLLSSAQEPGDTEELEALRSRWEKTSVSPRELPDLPESIPLNCRGASFRVYPALLAEGNRVELRLFKDRRSALLSHKAGVVLLYRMYFSNDLKFLKKAAALEACDDEPAGYFGGRKAVEQKIADRVFNDLFYMDIRSWKDFQRHAEQQAEKILPAGRALLEKVLPVIRSYAEARQLIYKLESEYSGKPLTQSFLADLRSSLEHLVPRNFIDLYAHERIPHLARYIRALGIRAERGVLDLEKEQKKASRLKPFTGQLGEFLNSLDASASDTKRDAVEEFFWMIEEFKVSLFAQELKTPYPVSEKKLESQAEKIRRMV